ncbi:MAG TPA: extracellular solute-binding protein [Thermomicrobiales bacterium]|nr:extracellular solute-binding protein [Thermomicrobiales bacterium]
MGMFRRERLFSPGSASRRMLLKRGAMLGTGAALANRLEAFAAAGMKPSKETATLRQSTPSVDISGTGLKILQWSHIIPSHDTWFDQFVQEWSAANGVVATIDHIAAADIPAAFAAEIAAGQGHDLIEHIAPLAQFEEFVVDLKDLWDEAISRYGESAEHCRLNSFNPTTGKYYAFCHGYAPILSNYRKSLWEAIDMPNGPSSYDGLLDGGARIYDGQGIQMGIGMSKEIDSQTAALSMIWAFGGAIQDENENVILNSPETIEAVNYMKDLFQACMTPEVLSWNAASNNRLLVADQASYILNAISAYRTAQDNQPNTAADIFFSTPLNGPAGEEHALAPAHAAMSYHIPTHAKNPDTAREFILHLLDNYDAALLASRLYNIPAFPATAPGLDDALENDPNGSDPADKLLVLKDAANWTVNLGWPGPTNAMTSDAQTSFTLSNMMAKAARDEMPVSDAVEEADRLLNESAEKWRTQGLMGGGQ